MYVVRIEMLDDLAEEGCPICTAADRVERAWLRGLLDEVGDAKVRAALEEGGGLCAGHVRVLVDVAADAGKTLGLGVVLEGLVSMARDDLASRPRVGALGPRRRSRGERREPPGCGACQAVQLRERAYRELLFVTGDTALQQRSRDPRRAMCRPHFAMVRAEAEEVTASTSAVAALNAAAREKADQLLAGIARSIAAHSAGAEVRRNTHDVILRDAPEWLAGRAGEARRWVPAPASRRLRRRGWDS